MRNPTPVQANDTTAKPDYCEAVTGVEYDVHVHGLGLLDVTTDSWIGNDRPYCVAICVEKDWAIAAEKDRDAERARLERGGWDFSEPPHLQVVE